MPPYTDDDMRKFEYHEKNKKGIASTKCLYNSEHIASSRTYLRRYDEIAWQRKNGCQKATCPRFMKDECWENYGLDPAEHACPLQ